MTDTTQRALDHAQGIITDLTSARASLVHAQASLSEHWPSAAARIRQELAGIAEALRGWDRYHDMLAARVKAEAEEAEDFAELDEAVDDLDYSEADADSWHAQYD